MFGENLRAVRETRKMSRAALARMVNVAPRMIGMIEQGLRAPSLALAVDIADALDSTVDDLVHGRQTA